MGKVFLTITFLLLFGQSHGIIHIIKSILNPMESSWETTLPNQAVVKETAIMYDHFHLVSFISKNSTLTSAGFTPSVSLYDFNTHNIGIRFFLPTGSEACFITSTSTTYADVKKELMIRRTAREIETGTPQIFTAEADDRLHIRDLLKKSLAITKHCYLAVIKNNVFHLTQGSPVIVNPSALTASGLITPSQMELSVPFQIFLDRTITLN